MIQIAALDYMIANGLYTYHCDPWMRDPQGAHYASLHGRTGQINYAGEMFVIQRINGTGGGAMWDSPDSAKIIRIRQEATP